MTYAYLSPSIVPADVKWRYAATSRPLGVIAGTTVIGPKKLSAIREELERAFAATADDPIRWLEERMAAPSGKNAGPGSEVLQSLERFLEKSKPQKRRKARSRSKQ
jgi:hypothetical protein